MQVDFAFLCDAAAESGGKVHAIGIGFERINVQQLPASHPKCVAVVRFAYTRADLGPHGFRLRVLDGDGRDVFPGVEGRIDLELPADADRARGNMIMELAQLEFQTSGPHEVTITLDDREFVSLPFEVVAPG
ncbi:MAG: hypothetical protein O2798_10720 [Chloroflexi bacterium]|nr:hypothetical protein [Chloroflexota bacterium]MDA1241295.1 hypothetical protein [Chloroflexota bacterium]